MASSKVMASRSPPNQNHPRQPSPSAGVHLHSDQSRGFGSMNIDDFIRNMDSDPESPEFDDGGAGEGRDGNRNKTVEDVWTDIVRDGAGGVGIGEPAMTLEDFLAKAGAVNAGDVRVPAAGTMPPPPPGGFGMEAALMSPATGVLAGQFAPEMTTGGFAVAGSGGGRGKRTAVEQVARDKATQQKQRRMIKNRESAARSRERKQAYNLELESLVSHLEEENERLLKEEAELKKKRYKQLMENLIPVVEMRRPPRVIKRVRSMEW